MKQPDNLLYLDASEVPGLVALQSGERLAVALAGPRRGRGRTLLAAVAEVLGQLQLSPAALQGVLVCTGPGSFTGVRVGIATAQGLAAARGWRPLVCDSLMLEAAAYCGEAGSLAVCHDARRGEVYAGLYDVSGKMPRALVPPFCAPPVLARELLRPSGGTAVQACAGSGAALLAANDGAWVVRADLAPESRAQAAFDLAARGGCTAVELARLAPFYLRHPDLGPRVR
ncbi:MAG TPA: tRNA (adenosine(37)-N6)-threonylcarbamoyltransferase complex dimerization subunit type 1 TsaB [Candidatus Krumholzibacteria bacterium]|nr:tRNA (adenosine(37)-N6)-threonylcarbamoyltransferase complex dimerization subunit type 1 TsaB [Candidatus Krumholzibacteria bacterium]